MSAVSFNCCSQPGQVYTPVSPAAYAFPNYYPAFSQARFGQDYGDIYGMGGYENNPTLLQQTGSLLKKAVLTAGAVFGGYLLYKKVPAAAKIVNLASTEFSGFLKDIQKFFRYL